VCIGCFSELGPATDLTTYFTYADAVLGLEEVDYGVLRKYLKNWRSITALLGDLSVPRLIRAMFKDYDVVGRFV
jgi:hypothetical protein